VPDRPLTFTLEAQPNGVALNTLGLTNAAIVWPTTEAQGPLTNSFLVKVTDVVNNTPFTRTNTFTVVVNEINEAPVLTVPNDLSLDELTPLNASASATDVDLPANA